MEDSQLDEVKRHFDVVAERLQDHISLVTEGHQLLAVRLESLSSRFDRFDQRIDRLESEIKAMLRLSFVELERRVLGLESVVADLARRVEHIEATQPH